MKLNVGWFEKCQIYGYYYVLSHYKSSTTHCFLQREGGGGFVFSEKDFCAIVYLV